MVEKLIRERINEQVTDMSTFKKREVKTTEEKKAMPSSIYKTPIKKAAVKEVRQSEPAQGERVTMNKRERVHNPS